MKVVTIVGTRPEIIRLSRVIPVLDAHTERARTADTLSGGEGFLASLALALGLADAVQSAAGRYKLESVFIVA